MIECSKERPLTHWRIRLFVKKSEIAINPLSLSQQMHSVWSQVTQGDSSPDFQSNLSIGRNFIRVVLQFEVIQPYQTSPYVIVIFRIIL